MPKSALASTILAALGGLLLAAPAHAAHGRCNLNASNASGTYGFAGQGFATSTTASAPADPIVQSGTVTQTVTSVHGNTLSGTWSALLAQNDSAGYHPNVSFGGTFTVDGTTCQGDFYVTGTAPPAFHVVFVDDGDELRTISLLPGLFLSYPTAKRL